MQNNNGLSADELDHFNRDGFIVKRGLFSAAEIDNIRETFMTMAKDGPVEGLSEVPPPSPTQNSGDVSAADPLAFYPRMMHPHKHLDKPVGPLALNYMRDPRLHPILRDLFGEEPLACQSMFYFKPPGARGQALHQDNFFLRVKPGTCMAAWLAIDDADEENGGMMCVPQTSTMEIACPEKADPTLFFTTEHVTPPEGLKPEHIRLKAGDVLFFNGNVIHGSTPNTSKDRFRRSLIFHYAPASTQLLSTFYEACDFYGASRYITFNNEGGPCGTHHDASMSPH